MQASASDRTKDPMLSRVVLSLSIKVLLALLPE